jgi:hypothetical protein
MAAQCCPGGRIHAYSVLYHPDYTVGSGITPDLLTLLKTPQNSGKNFIKRSRARHDVITAGGESHPAPRTCDDAVAIAPFIATVNLS